VLGGNTDKQAQKATKGKKRRKEGNWSFEALQTLDITWLPLTSSFNQSELGCDITGIFVLEPCKLKDQQYGLAETC
jgi:hypothetical protein